MDKLTNALGYAPRRIAIFRAIQLGDLLCAVPAFRALRAAFPEAHIALIGLPWAKEFVASYPRYFDEFIAFPGWPGLPEQPVDPVKTVLFLQQMQNRQWDVVLQMQGNGTLVNAMLSLVNASALGGYYPADIKSEEWAARTGLFVPYPVKSHEVQRHLGLMRFLGIALQGDALEFDPDETARQQALTLLTKGRLKPGQYVCVHPGGVSGRRWPAHRFADVADALAEKGYTVVLTGTAGEIPIIDEVQSRMDHPAVSFAGQTSLATLGAILQFAALLVSNDTGVGHLGTACHTPSIILFTSADPAEWGPLDTSRHRVVFEEDAQDTHQVMAEASELLTAYRPYFMEMQTS
ncbi:glycosyltransferase family 9 protein [Spirosoma fluviale]|uniref:ADP-heptose:LPS heptosyltransferase n=1 Tax=Spirosoma fluviale TaxID=1597977 RepID=A0A286F7Z3_9BACT|nr:glycosyltransferase family 9 protein [Spirosoma fluviale]SOD79351.1 ADP-heptose:LPS heptosyltransferase [Spirosoma fluviale]